MRDREQVRRQRLPGLRRYVDKYLDNVSIYNLQKMSIETPAMAMFHFKIMIAEHCIGDQRTEMVTVVAQMRYPAWYEDHSGLQFSAHHE